VRRVARRVGQRLLGDPVDRDADAGGDAREVASHAQLDGQTARPRGVDERGDLARRGQRRSHARLVLAAQQRDRAAQLLHAATTHVLGRPQCLLGSRGVAAQHVPCAGDLEHDRGQPVSDEVVNVAGDLAPLGQQRLLCELAPGVLQLGRQLALSSEAAAQHPRERDPEDPDAHRDLGGVLDDADGDRRGPREQAQRNRRADRARPAPDDEGEQRDLEHERLESPGALRGDHRHDHGERDRDERHPRHVGPRCERGHRDRGEEEIARGPRVGDRGDDGDREGADRHEAAQLVGLGPPLI
jgi:hypothetical protein